MLPELEGLDHLQQLFWIQNKLVQSVCSVNKLFKFVITLHRNNLR